MVYSCCCSICNDYYSSEELVMVSCEVMSGLCCGWCYKEYKDIWGLDIVEGRNKILKFLNPKEIKPEGVGYDELDN